VALTYGWDYRLAAMLGAALAAALARWGWRKLPAERVADRLALAFAGALAAALFCAYASDWLDWQPLDIDDAVAGMTIGLLLLLAGPVRRVLHHATQVPTAAGLVVVALALAPAVWAAFMHGFHFGALDAAAQYALIARPGFVAALAVAGVGFVFALRCRLYGAAMALSPVAWVESMVLVADAGSPILIGVLVGGIVGTGLMITSVYAWAGSVRNVPGRLGRVPASALIVAAKAFLTGPARRALRSLVCGSNVATLAAFVALALVPAALGGLLDGLHRGLVRTIENALLESPGREIALAITVLVFVLALRRRLHRTATLASVAFGITLLLFDIPYRFGIPDMTSVFLAGTIAGGLLLAARAAWRASASGAQARPAGLLLFLALASGVAFTAGLQPIEYFLAAATVGVWWWFYYRRRAPLVAPGVVERLGRRQSLLRVALGASLGVTVGAYLLLLEAAVLNQTGPEFLAELRERRLYRVSDITFARAMLADQYLWRDSVVVARGVVETSPGSLVEASRHPRDQWSGSSELWRVNLFRERKTKGYGVLVRTDVPGGRLVSYVHDGSPAHRAGVRRGDVIRAINGIVLDRPDAPWLSSFEGATRLELVSFMGDVREVTVAQAEYERSAVSAERVIDVGGRRVGYLELHNFLEKADEEFLAAAARLRAQRIDDLVLDLRMNPGGRIHASLRIASAIGGKRLDGRIFKRVVHNDRYRDRDRDLAFSAPLQGALSLPRVFVITSEDSCSASEGLINGLAPHIEVVTIGGTTCGKPVGSRVLEYGEREYSIITFRSINARGEGDYYNGLRPTCAAEDDLRRDFGDPEEASLEAALHYIRHGRCPEPAVWL